jgi:hypothetical protein
MQIRKMSKHNQSLENTINKFKATKIPKKSLVETKEKKTNQSNKSQTRKRMLVVEPDYLPDSEVFVFSRVYTP